MKILVINTVFTLTNNAFMYELLSTGHILTSHNQNPIEVVINEVSKKVTELGQLWSLAEVDMTNYP